MKQLIVGLLLGGSLGFLAACDGPPQDEDCGADSSLQLAELMTGQTTITIPVTESGPPLTDWMDYLREVSAKP